MIEWWKDEDQRLAMRHEEAERRWRDANTAASNLWGPRVSWPEPTIRHVDELRAQADALLRELRGDSPSPSERGA